jgi:hypothetical protein
MLEITDPVKSFANSVFSLFSPLGACIIFCHVLSSGGLLEESLNRGWGLNKFLSNVAPFNILYYTTYSSLSIFICKITGCGGWMLRNQNMER